MVCGAYQEPASLNLYDMDHLSRGYDFGSLNLYLLVICLDELRLHPLDQMKNPIHCTDDQSQDKKGPEEIPKTE